MPNNFVAQYPLSMSDCWGTVVVDIEKIMEKT